MRRLRDHGLDFEAPHLIDFNVDFAAWPPAPEAIAALVSRYQNVRVFDPEEGQTSGDVLIQIEEMVSYDFVVQTQATISNLMAPFGGVCEAWGVWQE